MQQEHPEKYDPAVCPQKEQAMVNLHVDCARMWNEARKEHEAKRQKVKNGNDEEAQPEAERKEEGEEEEDRQNEGVEGEAVAA